MKNPDSSPLVSRFLNQLSARGLKVVGPKDGDPADRLYLQGPEKERTPEVMTALKAFKSELVKRYGREKPTPPLPVNTPSNGLEDPKPPVTVETTASKHLPRTLNTVTVTAVPVREPEQCGECKAMIYGTAADAFSCCDKTTCPFAPSEMWWKKPKPRW